MSNPPNSHKQPNSHQCFVCGLQNPIGLKLTFHDNGEDEVHCEYSISEEYQGYPGIAHGGIVAAILDEVVGRTSLIGDPMHLMMTAKMEIKYRQPVPLNTPLTITGKRTKDRGRVKQARGEIRLPDGSLAVEAFLTIIDLPPAFKVNDDVAEQLGWRVYE